MESNIDSSDAGIVTVDVKTAKDLLRSGYRFLDVRTVEEFEEGHVATEKIVNVPYLFNSPSGRVKNPDFVKDVSEIFKKDDRLIVDKENTVLERESAVHAPSERLTLAGCRSGVRSLLAIEDLRNGGFEHLWDLGGGHLAWVENGFPVVKPEINRIVVKSEM